MKVYIHTRICGQGWQCFLLHCLRRRHSKRVMTQLSASSQGLLTVELAVQSTLKDFSMLEFNLLRLQGLRKRFIYELKVIGTSTHVLFQVA